MNLWDAVWFEPKQCSRHWDGVMMELKITPKNTKAIRQDETGLLFCICRSSRSRLSAILKTVEKKIDFTFTSCQCRSCAPERIRTFPWKKVCWRPSNVSAIDTVLYIHYSYILYKEVRLNSGWSQDKNLRTGLLARIDRFQLRKTQNTRCRNETCILAMEAEKDHHCNYVFNAVISGMSHQRAAMASWHLEQLMSWKSEANEMTNWWHGDGSKDNNW